MLSVFNTKNNKEEGRRKLTEVMDWFMAYIIGDGFRGVYLSLNIKLYTLIIYNFLPVKKKKKKKSNWLRVMQLRLRVMQLLSDRIGAHFWYLSSRTSAIDFSFATCGPHGSRDSAVTKGQPPVFWQGVFSHHLERRRDSMA